MRSSLRLGAGAGIKEGHGSEEVVIGGLFYQLPTTDILYPTLYKIPVFQVRK